MMKTAWLVFAGAYDGASGSEGAPYFFAEEIHK